MLQASARATAGSAHMLTRSVTRIFWWDFSGGCQTIRDVIKQPQMKLMFSFLVGITPLKIDGWNLKNHGLDQMIFLFAGV